MRILFLGDVVGRSGRTAVIESLPRLRARYGAHFVVVNGENAAGGFGITEQILTDRLRVQDSRRQRISIGWVATTSEPVTIPACGVNVLIHGDPHSGKSWLAGLLAERLVAAGYSICVIDPEGDYRVLAGLPGVTWTEVQEPGDVEHALAEHRRDPAASTVLDLSSLPHAAKVSVIERALRGIREIRGGVGRPHWTFIDEAHYSLHGGGIAAHALDVAGRGFCFVTYRPSWLRREVTDALDVFMLARTSRTDELAFLASTLPAMMIGGAGLSEALQHLPRGEFLLVRRDPERPPGVFTFVAAPRQTVHVRHLTKYVDSCVAPGREFRFRGADGRVSAEAASLHSFRHVVATAPTDVLAHHAERGDFSRWVHDVFADAELARQLRKIEARWRRRELEDLREPIDAVITVRYGADR